MELANGLAQLRDVVKRIDAQYDVEGAVRKLNISAVLHRRFDVIQPLGSHQALRLVDHRIRGVDARNLLTVLCECRPVESGPASYIQNASHFVGEEGSEETLVHPGQEWFLIQKERVESLAVATAEKMATPPALDKLIVEVVLSLAFLEKSHTDPRGLTKELGQ